jgi:Zn-dependent protease with chaperone function
MRDFFEHQDAARAKTRWLAVLFALALVAIVVAVYLAAVLAFGLAGGGPEGLSVYGAGLWRPDLFLWTSVGVALIVGVSSLYKTAALSSGGGSSVATLLGGRAVDARPSDPGEQRLRNVVEEMAIASGTPVPELYVLDGEDRVNAFAAGLSRDDAVIAVTRGCLEQLDRDQLQGVVAHEFSHISHGDMRLNVRLMGWVFGILVIGLTGRLILRFGGGGGDRKKGGGPVLLFGLALFAIGYIGFFFTRLLQSAVSRQREFLADASAVQYTRQPSGLARALAEISQVGSRLDHPKAEQASHFYFASGVKSRWFSWTATHPPVAQRIERLDPDHVYRAEAETGATEVTGAAAAPAGGAGMPGVAGLVGGGDLNDPGTWVERAGNPRPEHLAYHGTVMASLDPVLPAAARETVGAQALLFALLLDQDEELRARQMAALEATQPPEVLSRTRDLARLVDAASPRTWLPLIDLTLPALRRLSPAGHRRFRDAARFLAEADRQTDLFELVLERILLRHLDGYFHPRPPGRAVRSARALGRPLSLVLSSLAHFGQDEPAAAAAAFRAGAEELADAKLELLPDWETDLAAVGDALDGLGDATPSLRRRILRAAVRATLHDREVTVREAEMVRAVADALDCPMPPLLAEEAALAT